MESNASVAILLVCSILAHAVKAGVAADALCAAAGLDATLLDDPGARIPFATHMAFWREAAARSGEAYGPESRQESIAVAGCSPEDRVHRKVTDVCGSWGFAGVGIS
jgi:hypothetical protein